MLIITSVCLCVCVCAAPVVTGTGPNFSLGELQGHLAYDLNPSGVGMRRTLPSTSSSGSVHASPPHICLQQAHILLSKALCPWASFDWWWDLTCVCVCARVCTVCGLKKNQKRHGNQAASVYRNAKLSQIKIRTPSISSFEVMNVLWFSPVVQSDVN